MSNVLSSLYDKAAQVPNQLAFVTSMAHGTCAGVTYQKLALQVDQLALALESTKAKCIAIYLENSIEWIVADLATLKCGIACVPIPRFFSSNQINHVLREAPVDLIIAEQGYSENTWVQSVGNCHLYRVDTDRNGCKNLLSGTAKVTFTSGSTGSPKGVCLSQQALEQVVTSLSEQMANIHTQGSHLVALPLSTLLENLTGVYVPLLLGVTSVVLKGEDIGLIGSSELDFHQMNQVLSLYQPSSMAVTPALLKAIVYLAQAKPDWVAHLDFVAVGGARVPTHIMEAAHQLAIPAYEGYGLSEMASVVSLNTPNVHRRGSCGKALSHCDIKFTDDGELLVKGSLALGYLSEPFTDKWFATGDIATLDSDGFITIIGRKKNQIITSFGRNISPEWVELEAQKWPAISTIFVVGEGQARLTALVVFPHVHDIDEQLTQLNADLPDYAQITRFVQVESMQSLLADAQFPLFTQNGRPIRSSIEHYVANAHKHSLKQTITETDIQIGENV
jgi:long-chain acyl-CoA synthetase